MVSRSFPQGGYRPRVRPTVEALEGRECPTVTVSFADGVLTVVGDDGPNQVAIVELGGGAVEVTGDGAKSHFEGVRVFDVSTLGGDDRVEYGPRSAEVVRDVGDRDLFIDVGAGDDRVTVRDHATPVGQPVVFTARVHPTVHLGTGGDYLLTSIQHSAGVQLDVFSADGGDGVEVRIFYSTITGKPIPVPVPVYLDLGGGGNLVSLATRNVDDVSVTLKTSTPAGTAGSVPVDSIALTFDRAKADQLSGAPLTAKQRVALDLGGADDRVTIDSRGFADVITAVATGAGSDRLVADYTFTEAWPSKLTGPMKFDARLGDGDDRLDARFAGYADAELTLDSGAGDDRARVSGVFNRLDRIIDRLDNLPRLAFDARLGDGDDRLDARFAGYADADLNLDFGAGADRGRVILWVRESTQDPTVSLDAQLGAGDDTFRVATRGYHEVRMDLDTGPDGDGTDQVSATSVLPGARRNRITLLSMDVDRVQVLGVGYLTADLHLEGHQCLAFLLGGIP